MKAAPFRYHRPSTVDEATRLLAEYGDDAKVLAGGQSLLPMMAYRLLAPGHIVDVGGIDALRGYQLDGDYLVVGAGVRQRELERSADVGLAFPPLHQAIAQIAHVQIRNRGTVCGSLAHADPAAELPSTMVALDATMVTASARGRREIPAAEFFEFYLTSALQPDELLTHVRIPRLTGSTVGAFCEISHRVGDFALVGVMAVVDFAGDRVARSRIVCSGVGPTPFRASEAEAAIADTTLADDVLLDAQGATPEAMVATDDVHATGVYRRHVAGVLVRRCLAQVRSERGAIRA